MKSTATGKTETGGHTGTEIGGGAREERETSPRGYLIVHQDWYELPGEDDPQRRIARVTTLNPDGFPMGGEAELFKHCYEVLEVVDATPFGFTIGECRAIGQPQYETLDAAKDYLRGLGVRKPRLGFNPTE